MMIDFFVNLYSYRLKFLLTRARRVISIYFVAAGLFFVHVRVKCSFSCWDCCRWCCFSTAFGTFISFRGDILCRLHRLFTKPHVHQKPHQSSFSAHHNSKPTTVNVEYSLNIVNFTSCCSVAFIPIDRKKIHVMYHFSFAPRMGRPLDTDLWIPRSNRFTKATAGRLYNISCAGKKTNTAVPPTRVQTKETNENKNTVHWSTNLQFCSFIKCPKFQRERKTADIRQTFYIRTIQGTYGWTTVSTDNASVACTSVVCGARFARR
jgi:hypothetical protein